MTARLTFLGITVFWVTMNVLLWRAEFGSRGGDTEVPLLLVWHKILTAPDASSLSFYQNGERVGYGELSTAVEQQMASLDDEAVPPGDLVKQAGYRLHLAGNLALGAFTNRIKFEGQLQFANVRQWRALDLKITLRLAIIEIHAAAANETVHVKITSDGETLERSLSRSDLQNPAALLRVMLGGQADPLLDAADLPVLNSLGGVAPVWTARRTRVRIGRETMPIYRLETTVLGHNLIVDCSILGEVLHVELPGNFSARIDEWPRHD